MLFNNLISNHKCIFNYDILQLTLSYIFHMILRKISSIKEENICTGYWYFFQQTVLRSSYIIKVTQYFFSAGKHFTADSVCGIPVGACQHCSFCCNCKYQKLIQKIHVFIYFHLFSKPWCLEGIRTSSAEAYNELIDALIFIERWSKHVFLCCRYSGLPSDSSLFLYFSTYG